MGAVKEYFEARRGNKLQIQGDFDYWGMDQSEESTRKRLSLVGQHHARVFGPGPGVLVDVGCGGGLLLEFVHRRPELYVGVDMFADCLDHLEDRCRRLGQNFWYLHKPEESPIEQLFDVIPNTRYVACVGVLGRGRYMAEAAQRACIERMIDNTDHGYVVISTKYPGSMNEAWLNRLEVADVIGLADYLGIESKTHGPHEIGLCW